MFTNAAWDGWDAAIQQVYDQADADFAACNKLCVGIRTTGMTKPYWRAYFRFSLPLMIILGVADYLQRDRAIGPYHWLERLIAGLAISFVVPPLYLGAINMWHNVRR